MAKLEKVLVAYDGSLQSKEALQWAIHFGRRTGVSISAAKVFEPVLPEFRYSELGALPLELFEKYAVAKKSDYQLMDDVKELGRRQEVEITTAMLNGHVSRALLDYAGANGISLIVAGTRGHGTLKQLLLGSVTHGLVSVADIPILVVKRYLSVGGTGGGSADKAKQRKIMVAFDGYPQSRAALDWAIEIAKHVAAQIIIVKVVEPFQVGMAYAMAEGGNALKTAERLKELEEMDIKIVEEAKEIGLQQGIAVETKLLQGNVLESLLKFIEQNGIDIVAVGAQGHGVLDKLPLGSIPHGLISLSPIPVLVAKK